jgi:sulfatase modifying factor 1
MQKSRSREFGQSLRIISSLLLFLAIHHQAAAGPPNITGFHLLGSRLQLSIQSDLGVTNQIQALTNFSQTNWTVVTNLLVTQSPYTFLDLSSAPSRQCFYRVLSLPASNSFAPPDMVLIPAGSFQMGDTFNEGEADELPVHTVYVSVFYMDKYEVRKSLWDDVKSWSAANGYTFDNAGDAKGPDHPVESINWYDMVKWCNARSEKDGRVPAYYIDAGLAQVYKTGQVAPYVKWNSGYRLPTEAEWEKGSRGGASGHRFPWTNTDLITHSNANYYSDTSFPYDVSPTQGFDPAFDGGAVPFTSPAGSFAPNGYGLYDTAGNVWEWCWDWAGWYTADSQSDPRGPASGDTRIGKGGNWNYYAAHLRNPYRYGNPPNYSATNIGFRCALSIP